MLIIINLIVCVVNFCLSIIPLYKIGVSFENSWVGLQKYNVNICYLLSCTNYFCYHNNINITIIYYGDYRKIFWKKKKIKIKMYSVNFIQIFSEDLSRNIVMCKNFFKSIWFSEDNTINNYFVRYKLSQSFKYSSRLIIGR